MPVVTDPPTFVASSYSTFISSLCFLCGSSCFSLTTGGSSLPSLSVPSGRTSALFVALSSCPGFFVSFLIGGIKLPPDAVSMPQPTVLITVIATPGLPT